jgi:hypothetical protein
MAGADRNEATVDRDEVVEHVRRLLHEDQGSEATDPES